MEEIENVLEDFSSKLSTDANLTQNYRLSQYKTNDHSILDQESRRKIHLDRQKSLREQEIDNKRGILEAVKASEENEEITEGNGYNPSYVPGFTKKKNDLSEALMLSEWMTAPPEDLEKNWLVLACPKGVRVLLIATKGNTKTYNKAGRLHKIWQSNLPGGNGNLGEFKKCCILDCIWNEFNESIYVLDVLMWVNQPIMDCDMDFRDNWVKGKFSEDPSYGVISDDNHYPIYLVPKFNCDKQTLNQFMSIWPPFPGNKPIIDGFLFYHKEAHYVGGTTPLFVWLYPYMVNELLGEDICVHENYNKMKPSNYTDQKSFIKIFEEKSAMKQKFKDRYQKKNNFAIANKMLTASSAEGSKAVIVFGEEANITSVFNNAQSKTKKNKNRRRKNKNNAMDTESNLSNDSSLDKNMIVDQKDIDTSAEIDSAVSSMDDSLLEENQNGHDDSGFKAME